MDQGPKRESEDRNAGRAHGAAVRQQMSRGLAAVCRALGLGSVSALTPKARVIKVKTEKLALIKTENISVSKTLSKSAHRMGKTL